MFFGTVYQAGSDIFGHGIPRFSSQGSDPFEVLHSTGGGDARWSVKNPKNVKHIEKMELVTMMIFHDF